jgi:flagellin-like protein
MNPIGKRMSISGRRKKRGVSPIIATILLVAITVVLAAVLYVLISGLTGSSASTPYSLQMSSPTPNSPAAGTFYDALSLNPTTGLTTALFGLKISALGNVAVGNATGAAAACTVGSAFGLAKCPGVVTGTAPSWYVVLESSSSTVLATYVPGTWTPSTVLVNGADTLVVVTSSSISGIGDTITAFSTSTSSVSGSSPL